GWSNCPRARASRSCSPAGTSISISCAACAGTSQCHPEPQRRRRMTRASTELSAALPRLLPIHRLVRGVQCFVRVSAGGEVGVAGGEGDERTAAALEARSLAHLVEALEDGAGLDAGRDDDELVAGVADDGVVGTETAP